MGDSVQRQTTRKVKLKTRLRKSYDVRFKLKVLRAAEKTNNVAAAIKFGVTESTVRGWLKHKNELLNTRSTRKAFRGPKTGRYEELDNHVVKYINGILDKGGRVSRKDIQSKGSEIAKGLKIPETEFKASLGWCKRMIVRNGLSLRKRGRPTLKRAVKMKSLPTVDDNSDREAGRSIEGGHSKSNDAGSSHSSTKPEGKSTKDAIPSTSKSTRDLSDATSTVQTLPKSEPIDDNSTGLWAEASVTSDSHSEPEPEPTEEVDTGRSPSPWGGENVTVDPLTDVDVEGAFQLRAVTPSQVLNCADEPVAGPASLWTYRAQDPKVGAAQQQEIPLLESAGATVELTNADQQTLPGFLHQDRTSSTDAYCAKCAQSMKSTDVPHGGLRQQSTDDAEAALLRLRADKLLLEMEKLREERVRIAAERRNMALRVDITNLYQRLQSLAVPSTRKSTVLDAMQPVNLPQSILKQRLCNVPTVMADSHLSSENSSKSQTSVIFSSIVDDRMGSVQSSSSTTPSKSLTNTSFYDSVVSISNTGDLLEASSKSHAPHLSTMAKKKKRRSTEVTVVSASLVEETSSRLLPETYAMMQAPKLHSKTTLPKDVLVTDDRRFVAQAYTSVNVSAPYPLSHSVSSVTPAAAPSCVFMTVKPIRPDRLIQTENNSSPQLLEELPVAYGDNPMQGSYASVPIFKTECNIEAVIPKLAADPISVTSAVGNTKHPGSDRKLTVHSFVSDKETVLKDIDVAGVTHGGTMLSGSSVALAPRCVEKEAEDQHFSLDVTEEMKCELDITEEIDHKPQCSYSITSEGTVKRKTLEGEIPSKRRRPDLKDDAT